MPFSGGVRACPGETLSKERVLAFAAAILRKFRLEGTDDHRATPTGSPVAAPHRDAPADAPVDALADAPAATANIDPRDFQLGLILEPNPFKLKFVLL